MPSGLIPLLQVKLSEPEKLPDKWGVLFRYDPAVLVISIRWPEKTNGFGQLVRDRLHLPYTGNEQSVSAPYMCRWREY